MAPDYWPVAAEEPTCELRFNTMNARTNPILEQKWKCRDPAGYWDEWRPVPFVEKESGKKENFQPSGR